MMDQRVLRVIEDWTLWLLIPQPRFEGART